MRPIKKYWALTQMTRYGIEAMGLQCFAKTNYTWGLTSVRLPKEVDGQNLLKYLAKNFNLYIAGGQDHLKGRIIRIGHMGDVDFGDILFALCAISEALESLYHIKPLNRDFLEQAFSKYRDTLDMGYPGSE